VTHATPHFGNLKRESITTYEQFLTNKKEYESKYAEYCRLRTEIEENRKKFAQLGEQWKKAASHEKDQLDKKIISLYNDRYEKVQINREKHEKLHRELKEIKRIVKEAEESNLME